MKNRTNQLLLALFLLTAALYVLICLNWQDIFSFGNSPIHSSEFGNYLFFFFHAVPCFLLQLLLCRTAKLVAVRLIPVFLLVGIAGWFALGLATATGWDGLGWALLLALCIAPAVGYALAWTVYGIGALRKWTA